MKKSKSALAGARLLFLTGFLALSAGPALSSTTGDFSKILETIAVYEKQLGLTASSVAVFERGEGAVAFTSESVMPSPVSANISDKPEQVDMLKIRTLFDTGSDTIKKKVLIRRGAFKAVFTATLENEGRVFTQSGSGELYRFDREGETFLYSQVADERGQISLKEWIYARRPSAHRPLTYSWLFNSGDSSHAISLEHNPDGTVSVYQDIVITGLDRTDHARQKHVMQVVQGVFKKNSSVAGKQEIARLAAPVYWTSNGEKKTAAWEIAPKENIISDNRLTLSISEPASAYPLLIDPTASWGQWLGGGGAGSTESIAAIAVNANEIYVAGHLDNDQDLESVTFQGSYSGSNEGFIIEIADGATPSLVWGQWLGGTGADLISAVAINGDEIYVAGQAGNDTSWESVTFQGAHSGGSEVFVIEIADGTTPALNWGQWLGGTGTDIPYAIAVNGDEIYVAGYSSSSTSWESVTFQGSQTGQEGFVIEIADGTTPTLNWGQWLGGSSSDHVYALAVDGDEIYAGGFSALDTSWETVTFQGTFTNGMGFVVEIADGTTPTLNWGQWLGGAGGSDYVYALAVLADEIYAGGTSNDTASWPTVTFQGALSGAEGFVVEIADGATPSLVWGQWLGGSGTDQVKALFVISDEIYAAGYSTDSTSWESVTFQGSYSGSNEGFIIEIADGATPTLNWGQWLGGTAADLINAVAVDGDEIYIGGQAGNDTSWESVTFEGALGGGTEAFAVEIADGTTPALNWGQWLGSQYGTAFLRAIAIQGNEVYVGGNAAGGYFSESVTFQGSHSGSGEGFIIEIADGTTPTLNWGQWLGGDSLDDVYSIAVNGDEIYVGGYSSDSTSWESVTFQGAHSGSQEGFVIEIADGATPSLVWGQWLGGTGSEFVYSVAVTGDEIYAAGQSSSTTSWESVTFQGALSGTEGFVVEIADGATPSLVWGQWLGGTGTDVVNAIAINGDEIYVAGQASNATSWESVTFQGSYSGSNEGFIIEIADGATPSLVWGQWLGGTGVELVNSVAVTGDEIYAAGQSSSTTSWESVTFQGALSGVEAFVVEIADGATPSLVWGQWLGGTGSDVPYAVAVNGDEIYVAGYSASDTSWESVTFQGSYSGGNEGFIIEIADGATPTLNWGQWLGGSGDEIIYSLAVNGDGIYLGGYASGTTTTIDGETITIQGNKNVGNEALAVKLTDHLKITGAAYQDETSAALTACDGSTGMIRARTGSTTSSAATCADADGVFTLDNLTPPAAAGDPIVIWIDGVGSTYGTTATRYNSVDISSLAVRKDRLIVTHEDAGPVTNANLDGYDTNGDSDIVYDVTSSNLTVEDGIKTIVATGKTFTPGGTVTTSPSGSSSSADGDVSISSTATLSMGSNALSIGGDYANSGTFSQSSGQVTTFTATSTGHTLSGTLNGSSDFEKAVFNGTGGGWTIQSPMLVSAANATDTLDIRAGTVTLGDGNGDNLDVRGKWLIANTANQTATFQTASLSQGSTITIDMNNNNGTTSCSNCTIEVGASSGSGQGNFKLAKNTVLRLNPSTTGPSDTLLNVNSTGYLEVLGSLDTSGTSNSTTNETTLTDTGKSWTTNEHQNKMMRMTSGLAFGKLYAVSSNTATAITRADNSSANTTVSSQSTAGSVKTITTAASVISANNEGIGRYLHDTSGTAGWYKIVDTIEGGASDQIKIIAEPDAFNISNSDAIEISDGVIQGDSYEILDYANVGAESGASCSSTTDQGGESSIIISSGGEALFRYAEVCNMGRGTDGSMEAAIYASSVNGSNSNEGVTIDKSRIRASNDNVTLNSCSNLTSTKGVRNSSIESATVDVGLNIYVGTNIEVVNNNIFGNAISGMWITDASNSIALSGNRVYNNATGSGVDWSTSGTTSNTDTQTIAYNNGGVGIYMNGSGTVTVDQFTSFANGQEGIRVNGGFLSVFSNGFSYANAGSDGIALTGGTGTRIVSNQVYSNLSGNGIWVNDSSNNLLSSNTVSYNGYSGLNFSSSTENVTSISNTLINNSQYGVDANGAAGEFVFGLNTVHNNGGSYGGIILTRPSARLFSNSIYSEIHGLYLQNTVAVTGVMSMYDNFGGSGANTNDITYSGTPDHAMEAYGTTLASTTEALTVGSGASLISKKHDAANGVTKIWGNYSTPAAVAETPQAEETQKYNYADNLWEDSVAPHFYSAGGAAGSEDTNLSFSFSGAMGGDADVYGYFVVCNAANCVSTSSSWDVYRNGTLLTAKASTGSQYTDSQNDGASAPNVRFTIEDAGTDYTRGAAYSFVAYKKSGDSSTAKAITVVQEADTITVPSSSAIELLGQSGSPTTITRGGSSTDGYSIDIAGTINAQYYTISYLKGPTDGYGLDLQSGATVTNLAHGTFNNYQSVTAADAYLHTYSTLIGSGLPTKDFAGLTFVQSGGQPEKSIIEAGGSAPSGYWNFSAATCTGWADCESSDTDQGSGNGSIRFVLASGPDGSFFAVFD